MLPYHIHDFITQARREDAGDETTTSTQQYGKKKKRVGKEYPRMQRIALSKPEENAPLSQIFSQRASAHTIVGESLSFSSLSDILHSIGMNAHGTRTYPSGGTKYPIEAYLFVQRVEGLQRGAYHYHPYTHSLEHLWDLPEKLNLFSAVNKWAEEARVLILFTGSWWRNATKYNDFGYLLGMLETGHAAQNVLLAAAALDISCCPLAGFNDDVVTQILDLNPHSEQPVYSIAIG